MKTNYIYSFFIVIGVIIIIIFLIISIIYSRKPKQPYDKSGEKFGDYKPSKDEENGLTPLQNKDNGQTTSGDKDNDSTTSGNKDISRKPLAEDKGHTTSEDKDIGHTSSGDEDYSHKPSEDKDIGSTESVANTLIAFSESCVKFHNIFRAKHKQTNSVTNSNELVITAQNKADIMAKTGYFAHTRNFKFGENLYYYWINRGSAQIFAEMDCQNASTGWYDEIIDYNYESPDNSRGKIGHFTQMIWDDSKEIGCAKSYREESGSIYVVCHYNPAGNYRGLYPQHVMPLINQM